MVTANGQRAGRPKRRGPQGGRKGGGGKTVDQARREAFENAGMTDPSKVTITKHDPVTGTAVEFKGPVVRKLAMTVHMCRPVRTTTFHMPVSNPPGSAGTAVHAEATFPTKSRNIRQDRTGRSSDDRL